MVNHCTVNGTRRLLEAMADGGVSRLFHLSSMAVYNAARPPLSEGAPLGVPEGVYYVYIDNLVDALLLAAGNERSAGRTYNIVDGVTIWADWVERFRRITDGPQPKRLPYWLVRGAAAIAGGRYGIPLTEDLLTLTRTADEGYNARQAMTELVWRPAVDLDRGMEAATRWLRESGLV